MTNKLENRDELRVLVGDDDLGIQGILQKSFLRNYATSPRKIKFDFTANPEESIENAKTGEYHALMVDLNWEPEDHFREYKTGFRVLESVRGLAPVILLHTSEDKIMEKGIQYGATRCVQKHKGLTYMLNALTGGK